MTAFIGGEYLIAFGLMKAISEGNDSASFEELRNLSHKMQKRFNELDVDAVIIDSNLIDDLCSFVRYFEFVTLNHIPYVKCRAGISMHDLQQRFVGYLPVPVLSVMMECIK